MKKMEDYLHLYLGCKYWNLHYCKSQEDIDKELKKPPMILGYTSFTTSWAGSICNRDADHLGKFKIVLRQLQDITDAEKEFCYHRYCEFAKYDYTQDFQGIRKSVEHWIEKEGLHKVYCLPEQVRYLLSRQIDLFGLIQSGLALDATSLKDCHATT